MKKINLLLLLVVLIIWVFVFKKSILGFLYNTDQSKLDHSTEINTLKNLEKDVFAFEGFNYNPFLAKESVAIQSNIVEKKYTNYQKSTNNNLNNLIKIKPKKPEPEKLILPKISYVGYIKSTNQKDYLLIKVNDTLRKMVINEMKKDLTFKRAHKDSFILFYKTKKIILLKK